MACRWPRDFTIGLPLKRPAECTRFRNRDTSLYGDNKIFSEPAVVDSALGKIALGLFVFLLVLAMALPYIF